MLLGVFGWSGGVLNGGGESKAAILADALEREDDEKLEPNLIEQAGKMLKGELAHLDGIVAVADTQSKPKRRNGRLQRIARRWLHIKLGQATKMVKVG